MRRPHIVAIAAAAILYLGVSGWAVWHTYERTTPRDADTTSTTTVAGPGEEASQTELVRVPSYVGRDGFFSAVDAKNRDLRPVVIRSPSVTVALDKVISQSPEQGTEVPLESSLELTVSSGPP
jgi:hypothetical protein